jgi:PucR C-terminal helix-turn-helix domain/GGDEF-like domain
MCNPRSFPMYVNEMTVALSRPAPPPLPPRVAEVLRPVLPAVSAEIVDAIQAEVGAYARPLEGPFGQAVRIGTERALSRFVDLIADPRSSDEAGRRIYVELGRIEHREGRSLDALLAAYRVGARIAWRRSVEAGSAAGLPPEVLYRLGEAIFAYIDELSAESVEGYAEAQIATAGEREVRRRELIVLLEGESPDERLVRAAAAEAGWRLPATVAALVADGDEDSHLGRLLGSDVVATSFEGKVVALIPDPDGPGRRTQIEHALEGSVAALGPTVDWRSAADSIGQARLAHRLRGEGVLPEAGLLRCDDHLPDLAVHAEPSLAGTLERRWLAPLDGTASASRAKLERTLELWLCHGGRIEAVSAALDVHPQTVRYRLRRLRELFGGALDDPDSRLALQLALRVRRAH